MKESSSFRLIASYEASKGVVVFLFGIGLLYFLDHEVQNSILKVVNYLHIAPTKRFVRLILNSSALLTHRKIYVLELTALVYAGLRFVEAYGLWFQKNWGRNLAIISTAIYLPFEFYEWFTGITLLKFFITSFNIFLLIVLIRKHSLPSRLPSFLLQII